MCQNREQSKIMAPESQSGGPNAAMDQKMKYKMCGWPQCLQYNKEEKRNCFQKTVKKENYWRPTSAPHTISQASSL